MKLIFSEQACNDYLHWQSHDPKLLQRINGLIKECSRTPFVGPASQNLYVVRLQDGGRGESIRIIVWSTGLPRMVC